MIIIIIYIKNMINIYVNIEELYKLNNNIFKAISKVEYMTEINQYIFFYNSNDQYFSNTPSPIVLYV